MAAAPSQEQTTEQQFIPITSIEQAELLADSILQAAIVYTYEAESEVLLIANLTELYAAVTAANAGFANAILLPDLLKAMVENVLAVKADPFAVYQQLLPQVKAKAAAYAKSLT